MVKEKRVVVNERKNYGALLPPMLRFVIEGPPSGFFPVPGATGGGKTYTSMQMIYLCVEGVKELLSDGLVKEEPAPCKFFYMTELVKNIEGAYKDLKKIYEEKGKGDKFKKQVLLVRSNADSVLMNFKKAGSVPKPIMETAQYKACEKYVNSINDIKERLQNGSDNPEYTEKSRLVDEELLEDLTKTFAKVVEPDFRSRIKKLFREEHKGASEKKMLDDLERSDTWRWLGKMYPVSLIPRKRVVFLTLDKALNQIDTIVGSSRPFIDSEWFKRFDDDEKRPVVILDEFDSLKKILQRYLIEASNNYNLDIISLIKGIRNGIDRRINGKSVDRNFRDEVVAFYNKYSLDSSVKTDKDFPEHRRTYVFHKGTEYYFRGVDSYGMEGNKKHTILRADANGVRITTKKEEDIDKDKEHDIRAFITEATNIIDKFRFHVFSMAKDYYDECNGDKDSQGVIRIRFGEAVRSVLHEFGLKKEEIKYISENTVPLRSIMKKIKIMKKNGDFNTDEIRSFFSRGVCIYSIQDSPIHDMSSAITVRSYELTPEMFMLVLCDSAKVFGLSATIENPGIIENFSQVWLENHLKDRFVRLAKEERGKIESEYNKYIKDFNKKVNVNVSFMEEDGDINTRFDRWAALMGDVEPVRSRLVKLNDFQRNRIFKFASAYDLFLKSEDQSLLALMNKLPKKNDIRGFNKTLLFDILSSINNKNGIMVPAEDTVSVLSSRDFEETKAEIDACLYRGERKCIISTYNTTGSGQNLQHLVQNTRENKMGLVKTGLAQGRGNDGKDKDFYKDIDAIYLESPSYVVPLIEAGDREAAFESLLVILSLQANHELHDNVITSNLINYALKAYAGMTFEVGNDEINTYLNIYSCDSFKLAVQKIIQQANGRTDRTGLCRPETHIYADIRLVSKMSTDHLEDSLVSPKFTALVNAILERRKSGML